MKHSFQVHCWQQQHWAARDSGQRSFSQWRARLIHECKNVCCLLTRKTPSPTMKSANQIAVFDADASSIATKSFESFSIVNEILNSQIRLKTAATNSPSFSPANHQSTTAKLHSFLTPPTHMQISQQLPVRFKQTRHFF